MYTTTIDTEMTAVLRRWLLDLARRQDELAAEAAATTPYWKPQPATAHGHRSAADALRAEADHLLLGRAS